MRITTNIPEDRIFDLLTTAFEGGSNYWVSSIEPRYPEGKARKDYPLEGWWWHCSLPLVDGGAVIIHEGDGTETTLDRAACARGLELMSREYPRHWADFLAENDDAETADTFLQLAAFGELVYG